MCTAIRIVVAAPTRERRLELRRASVTADWEVVGEAEDAEGAIRETVDRRGRVLVVDAASAGARPESIARRIRASSPLAFVVGVGEVAGTDANVAADDLDAIRETVRKLLHDSGDHSH